LSTASISVQRAAKRSGEAAPPPALPLLPLPLAIVVALPLPPASKRASGLGVCCESRSAAAATFKPTRAGDNESFSLAPPSFRGKLSIDNEDEFALTGGATPKLSFSAM
jgi:hypothetical protein